MSFAQPGAVEVRSLRADEMPDWVATLHLVFHSSRPAQPEVDYRLGAYAQDLTRTLAAVDDGHIVATYESFLTELTLPGATCAPANAVSSVTVLPTHRRRGVLTRMITQDLRAARERGEDASVLIAAEYPIYGHFGFGPAVDHAEYRLDLAHARFLRDAPGHVSLHAPRDLLEVAPSIFEHFRHLHAGQIERRAGSWLARLDLLEAPLRDQSNALRAALYSDADNQPQGYVLYRVESGWRNHVPGSTLAVQDLITLTDDAYLGLWRFMAEMDLLDAVTADMRRVQEPLQYVLHDARKALQQTLRTDFLWLRPLHTERLLAARRYAVADRLVFDVADPLHLADGRFALEGGPAGATCAPSSESADLSLSLFALGAITLGGASVRDLAAAGHVEANTPTAVSRLERLFQWPRPPWCSTFF